MNVTLAFDVYGTLIDTHNIVLKLQEIAGDKAEAFSYTWRDKQLEYSFRRGLMQNYQDFAICTSNALDYACIYYNTPVSKQKKYELLDAYRVLPAFKDVEDSLARLKKANFRLYAFSNGSANAVETLLETAGIRDYFLGVVSVDDIKTFKPDPAVYRYFLKKSEAENTNTWLISSNPFDVIGAQSVGIRSVWVQRSQKNIFDPWGIEPTITVKSLNELSEHLFGYETVKRF